MDLLPDFGKYAPFIWAAYGISMAAMAWLAMRAMKAGRK